MAGDHSDKRSSDSDHDADKDRNEDVHDDALEETSNTTVAVVVSVRTVGLICCMRETVMTTSVMAIVLWLGVDDLDGWLPFALSATLRELRNAICHDSSPFADYGCAFLAVVCRFGDIVCGGRNGDCADHEGVG